MKAYNNKEVDRLYFNRNKPFTFLHVCFPDSYVFCQEDTDDEEEEVAEKSKPIVKDDEEEESGEVIFEAMKPCVVLLPATLSLYLILFPSCMHSDLSSDN